MYRRRRARIMEDNDGVVPAYATAGHGLTVDAKGPQRSSRRITTPDDPERGVSKNEFDAMVADIAHETAPTSVAAKTREKAKEKEPEPEVDPNSDADPEDLVLKEPKRKRVKNKRHGRPR